MLQELPIDSFLPEIKVAFETHQNLILTASPGAGKTTRLPPALLEWSKKKILVLEPRRIAAVSAAQRICSERNWGLGNEVGYQVRFESKAQPQTGLLFLTEALLSRKILDDPELSDVGVVVLDEFHERSVHTDLALGLLKELQELSRPDLKIVIMSATLETSTLKEYLPNSALIHVPGKIFPLEIIYDKDSQTLQSNQTLIEKVTAQIKKCIAQVQTKDILVFLPGVGEIERVFLQLEAWSNANNLLLCKLYGSLELGDQSKVLQKQNQRKIILATNIAESSLTVDGVNLVIDSGLSRQTSLHPKTGFPQLLLKRISKSSATQRAGRAARQEAGKCVRLWSKMDELSMPDHEIAEIFRTNLTDLLLVLSSLGIRDFLNFSWYEKPKPQNLESSALELRDLDLIDASNAITALGKKVLRWPLPARLSVVMENAIQENQVVLGAVISSLLSEKDNLKSSREALDSGFDCDVRFRVDRYFQRGSGYQVEKSVNQLLAKAGVGRNTKDKEPDLDKIPEIILNSFPDRLALRRRANDSSGVIIGGRGVTLDASSQVRKSEFFVALQMTDGLSSADTKISLACAIPRELVEKIIFPKAKIYTEIGFDEKSQKIIKKSYRVFKGLPLEEPRIFPVSAEEILEHLPEVAVSRWQTIKEKNSDLKSWLERYSFLKNDLPELPDLLERNMLLQIFNQACMGETKLESLFEKNLIYFFTERLSTQQQNILQNEIPDRVQVPSGSFIRVQYPENRAPFIEVRLQEVFGWMDTPKIRGNQSLTLHLLGPNYRPVQVTQDLRSFWKNAYPEVRKELKARYPKHSWPEDPTTAPAVAKGRSTKR